MPVVSDNVAFIRRLLDPMLETGDVRLLLDHVPANVRFAVRAPGRVTTLRSTGTADIARYFESLGDLLRFWQATYASSDAGVVAHIEESYVLQPAGCAVRSELALVFELSNGVITGLLVVEDAAAARALDSGARKVGGRATRRRSTAGSGW